MSTDQIYKETSLRLLSKFFIIHNLAFKTALHAY